MQLATRASRPARPPGRSGALPAARPRLVPRAAPPPKRRRAAAGASAAALAPAVADTDLADLVAPAPKPPPSPLPTTTPLSTYTPPTPTAASLTKLKLAFALPWRRTGSNAVLVIKAEGAIGEKPSGGRFFGGSTLTVPQICAALEKAAYDPRIEGVALRIGPLAVGWAKLQEIGEAMALFRASGKWSRAWIERGGEKELYLASMADRVTIPPVPGALSVRGVALAGTFLRGPLEKVGITPDIIRIGAYKSAGDSLLRRDMAPAQAEALGAIVDDVWAHFLGEVASRRGLSVDAVRAALDAAFTEPADLIGAGLVDGTQYEDQVVEELRLLTGLEPEGVALEAGKRPKPLRAVPLRKYVWVNPSAFGLAGGWGAPRIAVVRASGAITGGGGGGGSSSDGITAPPLVSLLNALAADKRVAAVVLRIDSPGGDALASDLIWRAARRLAARKPLVASMGDVAASGGYYIAMAAPTIVARPLTLTGSIGIVTGKVALGGSTGPGGSGKNADGSRSVYERVGGYNKTLVSRGRWAELLTETRPFTEAERALFAEGATAAYASFRDKAAGCRGMGREAMEGLAQGRVWTGRAALEAGLVDALGGTATAVAVAAAAAGVPEGVRPRVVELSRARVSPLALVTGGGAAAALVDAVSALASAASAAAAGDLAGVGRALAGVAVLGGREGGGGAVTAAMAALAAGTSGRVAAAAPDVRVVGSSEL